MGNGKKLLARRSKGGLPDLPIGKMKERADMPSIKKLIKDGFAEGLSRFPEMMKYAKIVAMAEDEYLPSGPPMSPLTTSFFTSWAFDDLRFEGAETLASCLIDASDVVGMNPDQFDALRKMAASRMGVYEHLGMDGPHVRLRELVTDFECACHLTSGYRGRPGELWYVRLLPPLLPDHARHHIAFTTPYILMACKDDWLQFLRRGLSQSGFGADKDGLHLFLKHGPAPSYWSEFVFKGYHHHQSDAIFLAGIPDLEATLPHA